MARKFYTPLSLTGLELQNFTVQNLPDNPSPYGKGHTYYNSVHNELRIYDGSNWVTAGGSIQIGLYADIPAAGNTGRAYATTDTQTLYVDNGTAWVQIGVPGNADYVNSISGTTNQVNVSQSSGDVTLSLPLDVKIDQSLQVGGWNDEDSGFITVKNYLGTNVLEVNSNLSPNDQYHGYGTYTNATGVININSFVNLGSEDNEPAGFLFVNPTGGGSTYPTVHLEATGDLALRAGASDSHANDGNIILYTGSTSGSGTGKVYIGWNNNGGAGANASNQVATIGDINDSLYITSVGSNLSVTDGELDLGSNVVITDGTQTLSNKTLDNVLVTGTTSFRDSNGDEQLTIDVSTIGTAHLIAADDLSLRAVNDIVLYPGNDAYGHTGKAYIHWGNDATSSHPDREIATVGTSQTFSNKTLTSATLGNNLDSDGYTITNLPNPTNSGDAANKAYVDSTAQGLSVLGSVRMATEGPIDITANASGGVGGVTGIANGDRVLVKSQTDATENGIYIYSSDSQTLVPSTVPSDTDIKEGSYVLVEEGTYAAQGWIVTAFTAGASTWTQFSAAGEYVAGYGIDISSNTISGVAKEGGGLTLDGDGFAASLGTGLQINGGSGAIEIIDYTYLTKKMAQTIGDDDNNSFDIYHNFGTLDVSVTIYDTDTGEEVFADVTHASTSKINVSFAVSPAVNQFRVVVVG